MALTEQNVIDLVRSFISEASAKYWTDAEITLYLSMAMNKLLSRWYPWLSNTHMTFENLALTAGTTSYSYPTNCFKVGYIMHRSTGHRLRYIRADELFKYRDYDAGAAAAWMHKNGAIEIIPAPASSSTSDYEVHYMPILDAVTEFPDCMRPLIAIDAANLALFKDQNYTPMSDAIRKQYEEAVKHYFAMESFDPVIFPDFEQESGLV